MKPTIFRAYDIRGIVPDELNANDALLIGKAFGTYVRRLTQKKSPTVAVGRDGRTHSPELYDALTEGLTSTGCAVTGLELCPTPYLYFANTFGNFDAGCNLTASHNPKEYNGFKMILKNGHAVFGDELKKLWTLISAQDFETGQGAFTPGDFKAEYQKKISSMFHFEKPLKLAVDCANGVSALLYPKMIEALGHQVQGLYLEMDGTFPNHEPDPTVEKNLTALKKLVVEKKCQAGLAFDGDGDRVGFVTEKGTYVTADELLMLLSKDVLTRHPGGSIVATVSNSQALFDQIKIWGGKAVICKVGHSYVENAMQESQAVLGGEQSGHFFVPENYFGYDDALVAALRALDLLSRSGKTLSELVGELPKVSAIPERRPFCPDELKFEVVKKISDHFVSKYPCLTLDGIRIDFGSGAWAGIRASNTSPRLSLIVEAGSPEMLQKIDAEILNFLKTFPTIDFNR